ncbi:DUF6233 domain-containing protein [Streptomyces chartreusis]|uniref:DUF6233 domain-containing protein n=1 Tax=Streptomyces chartreusis TaxID=1969 RepID=UPI00341FBFEE
MNELPPDSPRLREILAHLDKELAANETVGTYLRLQRQAVQAALKQAEAPPPRRSRIAKGGKGLGPVAQISVRPTFIVQQRRTPRGSEPSMIHLADCSMIDGRPHRITEHDARVSLTDPTIEACAFCRPDAELGIDVD